MGEVEPHRTVINIITVLIGAQLHDFEVVGLE